VCAVRCVLLQGANALEAVWLVVVLTVLLVVARAAFVVPFSLLHNCWSAPAERLSRRDIVIVWWAGLMRGTEREHRGARVEAGGGGGGRGEEAA